MRDYQEVFPNDLPVVPPVRKIAFGIKVLSDINPISNLAYRMAVVELKELNLQFTDFLDKGFNKPSFVLGVLRSCLL